MSIKAIEWVSGVTVGKGTDKAVLIALCNFHHEKNQDCSPGIDRISEFTELNRKTVMPALDRLQEAGFIDFEKGSRKHRKYTLNFDVNSPKTGIKGRRDNSTNFGTLNDDSKVPSVGTISADPKVPNTPPQSPKIGTKEASLIVPNTTSYSPKHDRLKSHRLDHEQVNGFNGNTPPVAPPQENPPTLTDNEKANMIIDKLNHIAGKNFRHTEANRKPIIARLREGFTGKDLVDVISNRAEAWLGTSSDIYLRPSTLFRPCNFESYLNDNSTGLQPDHKRIQGAQPQQGRNLPPGSTRATTLEDDLNDTSWATGGSG